MLNIDMAIETITTAAEILEEARRSEHDPLTIEQLTDIIDKIDNIIEMIENIGT